jgi:hypothetical protein
MSSSSRPQNVKMYASSALAVLASLPTAFALVQPDGVVSRPLIFFGSHTFKAPFITCPNDSDQELILARENFQLWVGTRGMHSSVISMLPRS